MFTRERGECGEKYTKIQTLCLVTIVNKACVFEYRDMGEERRRGFVACVF